MTKVVCLHGGPGTGKSTVAAKLFAAMKSNHVNAELVGEVVKQWALEGRKPVSFDQFLFFGKQSRRESSLFGKVDFIVTDAPVLLTSYYAQVFGSPEQAALFRQMLLTYKNMAIAAGHEHKHYFLTRTKKYDPRWRYQDEAGARQIDEELRRYIKEMGLTITEVPGDDTGVREILRAEGCLPTIKLSEYADPYSDLD